MGELKSRGKKAQKKTVPKGNTEPKARKKLGGASKLKMPYDEIIQTSYDFEYQMSNVIQVSKDRVVFQGKNGIGMLDLRTNQVVPGSLAVNKYTLYPQSILLHDGRILFVPSHSYKIGIYTPSTNGESTFMNVITPRGFALYSTGVLLPDGRVVFVPFNASHIGIFDPQKNVLRKIDRTPGEGSYVGGVLLSDGRVLFIPYNATNIGIFDTRTNTFSTIDGAPGNMAYGKHGVLLPDGRVVFVPINAPTIGVFDPNTNEYSTVNRAPGGLYRSGVLLPDGRVLFVPQYGARMGIFNPVTNEFNTVVRRNASYQSAVVLPDGRALFLPTSEESKIGVFNPVTNVLDEFDRPPRDNHYSKCTLLPDGRVLFVPYSEKAPIGIFDPETNKYSTMNNESKHGYDGALHLRDGRILLKPLTKNNEGTLTFLSLSGERDRQKHTQKFVEDIRHELTEKAYDPNRKNMLKSTMDVKEYRELAERWGLPNTSPQASNRASKKSATSPSIPSAPSSASASERRRSSK